MKKMSNVEIKKMINICHECKYFYNDDLPNLWCSKTNKFLNDSNIKQLVELGCEKLIANSTNKNKKTR